MHQPEDYKTPKNAFFPELWNAHHFRTIGANLIVSLNYVGRGNLLRAVNLLRKFMSRGQLLKWSFLYGVYSGG